MSDWTVTLVAWLLGFLLHGLLWLALAALLAALPRNRGPRRRDRLWKLALIGALATPLAQQLLLARLDWRPPWRIWSLESAQASSLLDVELPAQEPLLQFLAAAPAAAPPDGAAPPLAAEPAGGPEIDARLLASRLLALLWIAGALLGLARLGAARWQLRRALGPRRDLHGDPRHILEELCRAAGQRRVPRLSVSELLAVPVALGPGRGEICLPRRVLSDLDHRQLRSMLGHELCHLLRRDPAWLLFFQLLQRLFFFQPLVHVASRRAGDAAEELCDAWSAQRAGGARAMADCLAEVAAWLAPPLRPLPAPGMAHADSRLERRIVRLLAAEDGAAGERPLAPAPLAAALLLLPWLTPPLLTTEAAPPRAVSPGAGLPRPAPDAPAEAVQAAFLLLQIDLEQLERAIAELCDKLQLVAPDSDLHHAARELQLRVDAFREASENLAANVGAAAAAQDPNIVPSR